MIVERDYRTRAVQQDRTVARRDKGEVKRIIGNVLRGLPDQQRLVTIMHYADRMSYAEIGAVLDIQPDKAQRLHQEAKKTLKSALGID